MTQVVLKKFRGKLQFFQAYFCTLVFLSCSFFHYYGYSYSNLVIILVIKGLQSGKFSLVRVAHHHYDETIDGAN
jgi:hypothetical protein